MKPWLTLLFVVTLAAFSLQAVQAHPISLPPQESAASSAAIHPQRQAATEAPPWYAQFAEKFNRDRLSNSHAVLVLVASIVSLVVSLGMALRSAPVQTGKSWVTACLPILTLLGLPAAWDLLQTQGVTFALALVVFGVLVISILVPVLIFVGKPRHALLDGWYTWAVPLLSVAGITVASYLSFIEATQSRPVCGPLGDCSTVQDSPYAILFGILPVGILGLAGYLAIVAAWTVRQFGPPSMKNLASLGLWGMAVFGVLFSAYLTFLEPFVIGATCMWCINSAVLMILMLWVTTPAAQAALSASGENDEE
jgi:uncharacterized membrane protein